MCVCECVFKCVRPEIQFFNTFQFQRRGTAHVHALVVVKHDGINARDLTSTDEIKKKKVFDEIQRVITAKLVARPEDCDDDLPHEDTEMHRQNEKLFNWQPHTKYFPDRQIRAEKFSTQHWIIVDQHEANL